MDELDLLLGFDEEDDQQRLAAELVEADYDWVSALVALRKRRGLTQTQLGELMGRAQSVVSDIESMSTDPRLSTLRRYAIAVGASVEHVVRDTSKPVNVPVTVAHVRAEQPRVRKLPIKNAAWSSEPVLLGAQGE
ncbi:helix-turn-helix transcriptional regulator [Allokutzneria sp. NRRL B-24872]|uniref:helix-turn-helix domain-containing protein n=1 Tax=Allokutzneria sp. NRRL B-24872 TaxID=1137961 RepID=UPI00143D18E8|nr:helix-turn-helix transcriptional regulator [Allokutzneria sp. NRRL B-24872]